MRTLQEIQPGQTLGRYEFLVPIAEGGMASVWAARLKGSRGFSKTVAVKTMLPSVSDDPQFEQMFLDEAQLAARIRHPNVVEILDLGEEEEVLYLVMEWVDGEPLSNLRRAAAKQGGIPRSIAVRCVADACAGLHAAHELKDETGQLVGLVHRDISPQNILVTFDGVVKIVDFGVAKAAGRSAGQTTAGQVKGKPPYMSPEQALGEPVDRRTDVFALGIILYQLTTGKHPFRGESDLVTLQNIVSDRPIVPPRAHDKQYPRGLEALVMKALDRKRELRFQSCAELEGAIDEIFGTEITRARTEDVGKFAREMLGSRGELRRKALTDSIRAADERSAGRGSLAGVPKSLGSLTPATGTHRAIDGVGSTDVPGAGTGTDPHGHPITPFGATIPAPIGPKGRRLPFALAGAAILAVVVGALFAMKPGSRPEGSPAAGGPVASASSPVEAPPPVASVASAPTVISEPEATPSATAVAPSVEPPHRKPARRVAHFVVPPRAGPVASKPVPALHEAKTKTGFVPPPVSDPGF